MADNAPEGDGRKPPHYVTADGGQGQVLRIAVGLMVGPLQLDTDGKIVAALTPPPGRHPGMPGPQLGRHETQGFTGAPDKVVGRHPQRVDLRVVRMPGRIEAVGEQLLDTGPAETVGGQADGVDDDEIGRKAVGAGVAVGGGNGEWLVHVRLEQMNGERPSGPRKPKAPRITPRGLWLILEPENQTPVRSYCYYGFRQLALVYLLSAVAAQVQAPAAVRDQVMEVPLTGAGPP